MGQPAKQPSWYEYLLERSGIVVLVAISEKDKNKILVGYYDDHRQLAADVLKYNGRGYQVYTSINAPDPGVLERLQPEYRNRLVQGARSLSDEQVIGRRFILLDFDPQGMKPSSDQEKRQAEARSEEVRDFLARHGWPEPLVGMSGNGFHLLYLADIGVTPAEIGLVDEFYRVIARKFSDEQVHLDSSTGSRAQLTKAYQSISRKGEASKRRPHRRTWIKAPSSVIKEIDTGLLSSALGKLRSLPDRLLGQARVPCRGPEQQSDDEHMAGVTGSALPGAGGDAPDCSGDLRTLDIVGLFEFHDLYRKPARKPGMHFVDCPWEHEHSDPNEDRDSDTAIFESEHGERPGFDCKHDHCQERGLWDVVAELSHIDDFCEAEYQQDPVNVGDPRVDVATSKALGPDEESVPPRQEAAGAVGSSGQLGLVPPPQERIDSGIGDVSPKQRAPTKAEAPEAVAGHDGWESPVPIDERPSEPLPPGILPPRLDRFARALSTFTETPPIMAVLTILSVVSTALGGIFRVVVRGNYTEVALVWTCTLLESGNRKSAVLGACVRPLRAAEQELDRASRDNVRAWAALRKIQERELEQLQSQLKRSKDPASSLGLREEIIQLEKELVQVPGHPRLLADDTTPEALAWILGSSGGAVGILSPEGGFLDTAGGRYSSRLPNLDLLLKAFSGELYKVDRRSAEPLVLPEPYITLGLCPQPRVIEGLTAKADMYGRGLLPRFLFAIPKSLIGYRTNKAPEMPQAAVDEYEEIIASLVALRGLRVEPVPLDLIYQTSIDDPGYSGLGAVDSESEPQPPGESQEPPANGDPVEVDTSRGSDTTTAVNPGPQTTETESRSIEALQQSAPRELRLSEAARSDWQSFVEDLEVRMRPEGDLSQVSAAVSKLQGTCIRVAALLHISEYANTAIPGIIGSGSMIRAIRLIRHLLPHTKIVHRLLVSSGDQSLASRVLAWIRRRGHRDFSQRDAHQQFKGQMVSVADIKAALDVLIEHGFVREIPRRKRSGRPTRRFEVNPHLLGENGREPSNG